MTETHALELNGWVLVRNFPWDQVEELEYRGLLKIKKLELKIKDCEQTRQYRDALESIVESIETAPNRPPAERASNDDDLVGAAFCMTAALLSFTEYEADQELAARVVTEVFQRPLRDFPRIAELLTSRYPDWKGSPDRFRRVRQLIANEERNQERRTIRQEQLARQFPSLEAMGHEAPEPVDFENFPSTVMVTHDWEVGCGHLQLPLDQKIAVESKFQGLSLNQRETAEFLGWDPKRLESARRSLEQGRSWGSKLCRWFEPYRRLPDRKFW